MRLLRNLSGAELVRRLARFGNGVTRQTGGHMRLTSYQCGEHHVTEPCYDPLRAGTLAAILETVVAYHRRDRDEWLPCLVE